MAAKTSNSAKLNSRRLPATATPTRSRIEAHWDRVGLQGLRQAMDSLAVGDRLWLNAAIHAAQAYAEIHAADMLAEAESRDNTNEVRERLMGVFSECWEAMGLRIFDAIIESHPQPDEED